jgi:hypothetical protein
MQVACLYNNNELLRGQESWAPKLCQVATNICGFLVWILLQNFKVAPTFLNSVNPWFTVKLENAIFKNIGHENSSENWLGET